MVNACTNSIQRMGLDVIGILQLIRLGRLLSDPAAQSSGSYWCAGEEEEFPCELFPSV